MGLESWVQATAVARSDALLFEALQAEVEPRVDEFNGLLKPQRPDVPRPRWGVDPNAAQRTLYVLDPAGTVRGRATSASESSVLFWYGDDHDAPKLVFQARCDEEGQLRFADSERNDRALWEACRAFLEPIFFGT